MEEELKKKDHKKRRRQSQTKGATPDNKPQSATMENETGKPVTPPQEDEFPTEIKKEEPKVETKRTVEVEKREFQTTEFTSVDPKEYGIEFEDEEFKFEPMQRDDTLPDLRRLIDSLEDGQTDLETKEDPPALFTGPTHIPSYTKISELKLQIEKSELGPYLDEFEDGVKDEVVMLGQISLEEVQEEEKRLRDEHIEYLDQEALRKRDMKEDVLKREEEAKRRLAILTKQKRDDIARREIDWSDPWFRYLILFHIACIVINILIRNKSVLQTLFFIVLLMLVYFAESINEWAAQNYKSFSRQQYFDSNGLFISTVFSTPILINCLIMVIMWLLNMSTLMAEVRRVKHRKQNKNTSSSSQSDNTKAQTQTDGQPDNRKMKEKGE